MTGNVLIDESGNECGEWVDVVVEPSRDSGKWDQHDNSEYKTVH